MVFPLFWMMLLSLKSYPERYSGISELLFSDYTLSNFREAINSDAFGKYFLNSVVVAVTVTIGNIIFCLMAAYSLARKQFSGKIILAASVLFVLMIPPHIIMIPLYRQMVNFGWIDTYYALIIPWLVNPFGIFLLRQYIISLPSEIEDAARLDGAGEWKILFKVVAPMAMPAITVLAIYIFLSNWNSFLFPFLFVNSEEYRTLPVGLAFYMGKQSIDWGRLMAGSAIAAIPALLLFLLFQKQFIKGLTAGALKE